MDSSGALLRRLEQLNAVVAALSNEGDCNRQLEAILVAEERVWKVYENDMRALEEDREFLRKSNVGSETMNDEDLQRVRDIGSRRTWRMSIRSKPSSSPPMRWSI